MNDKWKWAKWMRPATRWDDDWHILKEGLPFNFDRPTIRDDIAVIVFDATVMSLDTRTDKERFNHKCLVVGFLPLAYAKSLKGTKDAGDVWSIVGVIPSNNVQEDMAFIRSKYSMFRHAYLPNVYYFAVSHFMSLVKTMVSVYRNTWIEMPTVQYDVEAELTSVKHEARSLKSQMESLNKELGKSVNNNIALQLENEELRKEIQRLKRQQSPDKNKGWVYLVEVIGQEELYKIGYTKNPKNRLKTFNVKLPMEIEYLHLIKTDDMYDLESELHGRFHDKRQNGSEFFLLTPEDVAYIKSL